MKLYLYKNFNNSSLLLKEAGAGRRTAHFHGRSASIEGAGAPYGRKVRQPLKGCALTKIGFANASIPSPFPSKKRTSHERFVNTSGVRSENQRFPIWRNDFGCGASIRKPLRARGVLNIRERKGFLNGTPRKSIRQTMGVQAAEFLLLSRQASMNTRPMRPSRTVA